MDGCISFCELQKKQVINVCGGRNLGYIGDMTIDLCSFRILSIDIPVQSGVFSFKKCEYIRIYSSQIEQIGEDAILVRAPSHEKCEKTRKF